MHRFEGRFSPQSPFLLVRMAAAAEQEVSGATLDHVFGLALIDTGSNRSGITRRAAQLLGMEERETDEIRTINGVEHVIHYRVSMTLHFNSPASEAVASQSLFVFEDASSMPGDSSSFEVVGLIGMDVLRHLTLDLDGPSSTFVVSMA